MSEPTSRSTAILAAVQRELSARKERLDRDAELAEVTFTVHLAVGGSWVKGVTVSEERIFRRGHG